MGQAARTVEGLKLPTVAYKREKGRWVRFDRATAVEVLPQWGVEPTIYELGSEARTPLYCSRRLGRLMDNWAVLAPTRWKLLGQGRRSAVFHATKTGTPKGLASSLFSIQHSLFDIFPLLRLHPATFGPGPGVAAVLLAVRLSANH